MKILREDDIEKAVARYGMLPFFRNNIKGFSIEEMTPPYLLFGGNEDEGAWEWKGPVIRRRTSLYGKFFNKKAGFVSAELMPHFLNWRRSLHTPAPGSNEEMLLDIIMVNDRILSTHLREYINGDSYSRRRTAYDLPELENLRVADDKPKKVTRHTLEPALQKLQMSGRLCISDFRYKLTKRGQRYGWGVAEYATPETLFDADELRAGCSPEESRRYLIERLKSSTGASEKEVEKLIKF